MINAEKMEKAWCDVKELLADTTGKDMSRLHGVNEMRERWQITKAHLFPAFGEDGRVEIAVTDAVFDDTLHKVAQEEAMESFSASFYKREGWENIGVYPNAAQRAYDQMRGKLSFTYDEIAANKIFSPRQDPERPLKMLPIGTKVSTVMKMYMAKDIADYVEDWNFKDHVATKERYDKLREMVLLYYSQLLNSVKVTPRVVLSVNPLDFLLASAHTSGWTSCHNFRDGGHRTGAMAYALDECSLIAYATVADETLDFENQEEGIYDVPVRLWRQMVFIDLNNKSAIHSRHYTKTNALYEKYARKLSARVISELTGAPYHWRVKHFSDKASLKNEEEENDGNNAPYYKQTVHGWHYQDDPASRIILDGGEFPKVYTGTREFPCICCGDDRDDDDEESYLGECCGGNPNRVYCWHCEQGIRRDDAEWHGDTPYCRSCFEEKFGTCYACDTTCEHDDLTEVHGHEYCESCRDRRFSCCEKCEDYEDSDEVLYVKDADEWWCEHCRKHHAHECDDCGDWFEEAEKICGKYYCEDCADDHRPEEEPEEVVVPEEAEVLEVAGV